MNLHSLESDITSIAFAPPHTCPACGGHVTRIRRRTMDRILGLFSPVWRYHCDKFGCDWEGNLSASSAAFSGVAKPSPRYGGYRLD